MIIPWIMILTLLGNTEIDSHVKINSKTNSPFPLSSLLLAIFLSSPKYPPILPSISTNCDDHLIPTPSLDKLTLKAHLTSLYMHPTDYTYRLYDKNKVFFTSSAFKRMSPYQYLLDNGEKFFLYSSTFFAHRYTI